MKYSRLSTAPASDPPLIFLSYGYDGNEELARRIKADLEKRGHDVWFEKNDIKSGAEWRRSITKGIIKSNKFISLLSKHTTRDPGVCRDEIAIAIGVKGWQHPDHPSQERAGGAATGDWSILEWDENWSPQIYRTCARCGGIQTEPKYYPCCPECGCSGDPAERSAFAHCERKYPQHGAQTTS